MSCLYLKMSRGYSCDMSLFKGMSPSNFKGAELATELQKKT